MDVSIYKGVKSGGVFLCFLCIKRFLNKYEMNEGSEMWNANGVLIQRLNEETKFIKKFGYKGLHYFKDSAGRIFHFKIKYGSGHNMAYLYQLNIVINDEEENIQIENEIEKAIEGKFKNRECIEIVGSQAIKLDNMICGKCQSCGAWTSDQDKSEHISSFSDGCNIGEVWLCDECLPPEHPKAF